MINGFEDSGMSLMRLTGLVLLFLGMMLAILWRFRLQFRESKWCALVLHAGCILCTVGATLAVKKLCIMVPVGAVLLCGYGWFATRRLPGLWRDAARGLVFGLLLGPVCAIPAWLWKDFLQKDSIGFTEYMRLSWQADGARWDLFLCAIFPVLLISGLTAHFSFYRRTRQDARSRGWRYRRLVELSVLLTIFLSYQAAGVLELRYMHPGTDSADRLPYVLIPRPGYVRLRLWGRDHSSIAMWRYRPSHLKLIVRLGGHTECAEPDGTKRSILYNCLGQEYNGEGLLQVCHPKPTSKNSVDLSRVFLAHGADPNVEWRGRPLLLSTIKFGGRELAQALLEHGADPNVPIRVEYGQTVLHYTVHRRHPSCILLLQHGADPNSRDLYGRTPVHKLWEPLNYWDRPIRNRRRDGEVLTIPAEEILAALLRSGADISAQDCDGNTALHLAISRSQPRVMRLLLANGADIQRRNNSGHTPVHWVYRQKSVAVIKLMQQYGAKLSDPLPGGGTAMHAAAMSGNHQAIGYFVEQGVPLSGTDHAGRTVIRCAIQRGCEKTIQCLIKSHGLSLHETNRAGDTLLFYPHSRQTMRYLLKNEVDINARNRKGQTALHNAIAKGYEKHAKFLIESGIDIHAVDNRGETALHTAARHLAGDLFSDLAKKGAKTKLKNKKGKTALELAEAACKATGNTRSISEIRNACEGYYGGGTDLGLEPKEEAW